MNLMNWNPLSELDHFFSRRGLPSNEEGASEWRPSADISETDDEYLIKADLPAVKKEDVSLTVHNGVITLSGERKYETRDKSEKAHRIEKFYGRFTRSFTLPDDVDADNIKAKQEDGVLVVHLPKSEEKKPRSLKIDVG